MKYSITGSLVFLSSIAISVGIMVAGDESITRASNQDEVQAASGELVVIGYLESRNRFVTISLGPQGNVFTVTKNGKTEVMNISEKEFEEEYPSLYHQIKTGVAGNDATLRTDDRIREILRNK